MNNLSNVSLWFAKDDKGKIITIDKIDKEYIGKYYCPLCGSEVIPKALESDSVAPHFAHIDKDKCSGEGIIHWWVKNELIKVNDVIKIITDIEKQVLCKAICFEKSYKTPQGTYKPDITIESESGEIIFIEVNFTNKKKIEEYLPKWKNLGNTVIEFNIKNVYNEENNKIEITNTFKALYYEGKEFSIDKSSSDYKRYIGSVSSKIDEEDLKNIGWFIDDIYKYNTGITNDIECMVNSFVQLSKNKSNYKILENLYRSSKCQKAIKDITTYKDEYMLMIKNHFYNKFDDHIKYIWYNNHSDERLIYDRLFSDYIIKIRMSYAFDFDEISYDVTEFNNLEILEIEERIEKLKNIYKIRLDFGDIIRSLLKMYDFDSNLYYHDTDIMFIHNNLTYKIFYNGEIFINELPICKLDLNNKDNFIKYFGFAMNYSVNKNYMFSENTINLYEKILKIFTKDVHGYYCVKIDNKTISISKYDNIISSYEYNKDTTFNDVVNRFSNDLRHYLYSGKEN